MKKLLCAVLGAMLALTSLSSLACTGEKAKDGGQTTAPAKPKT